MTIQKTDEERKKELEEQLAEEQELLAQQKEKHLLLAAMDTLGKIAWLKSQLGMGHLPTLQEALELARSLEEREYLGGKSSQLRQAASYFCHFGHLDTAGEIIDEIEVPFYKAHALIELSEHQKSAGSIATLEKALELAPMMESRAELVAIIADRFFEKGGVERALEVVKKLSSPEEKICVSGRRGSFGPYGFSFRPLVDRLDIRQKLDLLLHIASCAGTHHGQAEMLVEACRRLLGFSDQRDFITIWALGKLALQMAEAGEDSVPELSKIKEIRESVGYWDSTSIDLRLQRQMLFMHLAIKLAESGKFDEVRKIQTDQDITARGIEAKKDFIAWCGYIPHGAEDFKALSAQFLDRIEMCSQFWAEVDKECISVRQKAEERCERHCELIRKKARVDCAAIREKAASDCRSLPSAKSGEFQKPDFAKKPTPQPAETQKTKQGDKI